MKKSKKNKKKAVDSTLQNKVLPSDVLGSYTGAPENGEMPVQDADDL